MTVAVPAFFSVAVGVYTAFNAEAFGEKLPLPLHIPVDPPAVIEPLSCAVPSKQIVCGGPASTTGAGVMLSRNEADEAAQGVLFVDVSVMVRLPAAISAALGV